MPLANYKIKAKDTKGATIGFDVNGAPRTTTDLKAHCASLGLTWVSGDGSDAEAASAEPSAEVTTEGAE